MRVKVKVKVKVMVRVRVSVRVRVRHPKKEHFLILPRQDKAKQATANQDKSRLIIRTNNQD